MKFNRIVALIVASATILPLSAVAEDGDVKWTGELAAGLLVKRGNTDSNAISASANATRDSEKWRHTIKADALNEEDFNQLTEQYDRTSEKYFASYKLDRKLGEDARNYFFNVLTYDKDNFSGFHYQGSYALGLGRVFIDSDKHKLNAELGPGYKTTCFDPEDSYSDCDRKEEQAMARIAAKYVWQISEGARFTEEVESEVGEDNTSTRVESVLTTKINGSLSLRVRHLLTHESEVQPGFKETDHEFSVGVSYTF